MRPYTGIKKKNTVFGGINDIILVSDANFWPKMTKNEVSKDPKDPKDPKDLKDLKDPKDSKDSKDSKKT